MSPKTRISFVLVRFLISLMIILSLFGMSKAAHSQSLRLLIPNGGEIWYVGENKNISWTSSGFSPDVKVELLLRQEGKGIIGTIVSNRSVGPEGQVVWTWKVGQYQGGTASPGSGYKIQIKTMDGRFMDMSDRTFTLAERLAERKPVMVTRHPSEVQTKLPPSQVEKKPPTSGLVVSNGLDLTVKHVSKSQYRNDLLITYSTGNPNIEVVDKPLHFDICVEAKHRQYPIGGPPEGTLKLVNRRIALPARHVNLFVSLPTWPHYITGVDIWITINPDRSIQETNYENNTKHVYLWERERNYFKIHPWPSTANPTRIFLLPWSDPPFADWIGNTLAFNESMARHLINKGHFKYLPAVNGDMLQVPIKFAVARHCAEPKRTKLIVRYITYNGPRTYEVNLDFDDTTNVKVITVPLLLRIQRENFLDVSLEYGPAYGRLNIRFDHLPWNLN